MRCQVIIHHWSVGGSSKTHFPATSDVIITGSGELKRQIKGHAGGGFYTTWLTGDLWSLTDLLEWMKSLVTIHNTLYIGWLVMISKIDSHSAGFRQESRDPLDSRKSVSLERAPRVLSNRKTQTSSEKHSSWALFSLLHNSNDTSKCLMWLHHKSEMIESDQYCHRTQTESSCRDGIVWWSFMQHYDLWFNYISYCCSCLITHRLDYKCFLMHM